jgi:hypothetical protein
LLTGAVEMYANHSLAIIGSTAWPELDFGEGPASADRHHVAVRTRGQSALTRVSVWTSTMPVVGKVVFDGELDIDDYTICVGDIERLGRWILRTGRTGAQRVVVRVDDPGQASRVSVGLNIGTHVRAVPSIGEPALFEVHTSEPDTLAGPNERGLVLDGHDSAHARLSAAIRLLSTPDPSKPWLERYETGLIVEWLRWVGMQLPYTRAQDLGEELIAHVHAARSEDGAGGHVTPESASHIAKTLLDAIR